MSLHQADLYFYVPGHKELWFMAFLYSYIEGIMKGFKLRKNIQILRIFSCVFLV